VPTVNWLTSTLAAPFASAPVPSTVVPSRNVPVPVGAGRLLRVGFTCTEIVDGAEASVTTVPPWFMKNADPAASPTML
jgi:hypothetical protein